MEKFNPRKKKIVRKQAPNLLIHILLVLVFSILVPHINQTVTYLFLSNQEALKITLKTKQGETDHTCSGRYVYIHNLPSRFNEDLIESCESYVELRNKCKYLVNSGFGPPILEDEHSHTTRVLTTETGSWFSTNQFMLEVIFREKMKHYECLTNDSSLSSAVFVPYYAGFDVRRFWGYNVKLRDELGEDLAQWLRERPEWRKMYGRDHFFVTGRVGRDFRRASDQDSDWGNKLMRLPEFENMTMLSIETNSCSNEFAVPYPTYFHPKTRTEVETWQRQVRTVQRRYLFSFVGATRPEMEESIRGEVIKQCRASQECKFLNCDTPSKDCGNPVKVMEVFQDSVFCLQPPGDTPTRRSTFDSVLAGCIPVFFSLDSVQYNWHFPDDHTKYSVYISEEDVRDGKVFSIEKILSMISEEEILSMRNEVEKIIPKIIYAKPGDVGPNKIEDAFEIAVSRVLERVSSVLKNQDNDPNHDDINGS
ncbi:hypothetical protein N665_0104s0097 [Sinapis alba]|nr:hypothetical protein N665_0104s0097 [Sinapis alba]